MIIGISMGLETCQILGQVHSIYFIGRKTSKRVYVVRGDIDKKTAYIQAHHLWPELGENVTECQAEGEAKVVI